MSALAAYESGLRAAGGCQVSFGDDLRINLPIERWLSPAGSSDSLLLELCKGPTLDVGCGPGRMTVSLQQRGVKAIGIDVSSEAVRIARSRGATAHHGDVFGEVPDAGGWEHLLLADGNIGIGGSPVRLLRRARALIKITGSIVVDVDPPGLGLRRSRMRVEAHGHAGWLRWARVGVDVIPAVAAHAGLVVSTVTTDGHERHVVELRPG